ncbi:MAG: serine/threonine protein kinase [Deltaproteobacteria bacterium]|nr:serine/threonine protein kinase [Deltaproteobacteria bacterium]
MARPSNETESAATLVADRTGQDAAAPAPQGKVTAGRATVLPRVGPPSAGLAVRLVHEERLRYEPVRHLGAGGMGEVDLAHDNDIDRPIAVKRLLPEAADAAALARFVDEIRTIGKLEHPNIVPVHDVGMDEQGRYYFVMKYVEGETLESIIDKLDQGDPEYQARYSFERRVEIFTGLLHALQLAHDRGIVHRDVKPANVMVGRYGEVVLMDWGIAKTLGAAEGPTEAEAVPAARAGRMSTTQVGTLVGTPAYMAPEQAAGANALVDRRSDLYSACVLLHELMTLRHYLEGHESVETMLQAIIGEPFGFARLVQLSDHPPRPAPPVEFLHFVAKGLSKKPGQRFQSAAEMIAALGGMLAGQVRVQCHATLAKRAARELGRFVDRHPHLGFASFVAGLALLGFGAWSALAALL